MTKTSYDEIWKVFYNNCGLDKALLPQTDEGKYMLIESGILNYNTFTDETETELIGDEYMEEVNVKLDNNKIKLLAYCMKYNVLENNLVDYESVWQPLMKDIGQKFYREQISARQDTLARTKKEIDRLLTNIEPYSYL